MDVRAGQRAGAEDGVRLTHDPESGCEECPLVRCHIGYEMSDWYCAALEAEPDVLMSSVAPAPEWCPLRVGPVTVAKPRPGSL